MLSPPFLSTHTIPTTMFVICVESPGLLLIWTKRTSMMWGKGKIPHCVVVGISWDKSH